MSLKFKEFVLPFGGKLDGENRRVKLSNIIPWNDFESQYSNQFSIKMGERALPFRIALGALLIKERLCLTDRETVEQIKENPYLQYFLSLLEFKHTCPFDGSMLVHKYVSLSVLPKYMYRCLLVIHELYRQQREMYATKTHRISDRIVSITQPHVRPIVRGKAGKKVEFGAKVSASSCMGYSTVNRISWDAYKESGDFIAQAERYRKRFGYYPMSIRVDEIYRNRDNRKWCKKRNIRMSGPILGCPKKVTEENRLKIKEQRALTRQDEIDRIDIEGRFGHSKRRYGLDRVMAKLSETSKSVISM